jgi:ribonuclease P protein component
VLYVRPNGLALSRAGVSTPRGVGGAVRRNRLRRRIREALRLEQVHVGDGFDLVLVPRATSAQIPFAVLRAAVRELLAQAGVARGAAEDS